MEPRRARTQTGQTEGKRARGGARKRDRFSFAFLRADKSLIPQGILPQNSPASGRFQKRETPPTEGRALQGRKAPVFTSRPPRAPSANGAVRNFVSAKNAGDALPAPPIAPARGGAMAARSGALPCHSENNCIGPRSRGSETEGGFTSCNDYKRVCRRLRNKPREREAKRPRPRTEVFLSEKQETVGSSGFTVFFRLGRICNPNL